jgi:cytochrome P450
VEDPTWMVTETSLFVLRSEDPTEFGRRLAEEGRKRAAYYDSVMCAWILLRRQDILNAFKDTSRFSTRALRNGTLDKNLIGLEGEAHARLRRVYNMFFTPRALSRYQDQIVAPTIARVVDRLGGRDSVDLIDDFAVKVPTEAIGELFGLPHEHFRENEAAIKAIMHWLINPSDPAVVEAGRKAHEIMGQQIREIADRERKRPGGNLLSEIIRVIGAEGMDDGDVCEQAVLSLILGGYDTTIWMLANAVHALLVHPEAMARVRKNRALIGPCVEEASRWAGAAAGTVRTAECDVTFDGVAIPQGSIVYLCFSAAHYDEIAFPRPEVFDLDRNPAQLVFGSGMHYCAGAPLARMEVTLGLSALLDRFPHIRLDPADRPVFSYGAHGSVMFGPERLRALLS